MMERLLKLLQLIPEFLIEWGIASVCNNRSKLAGRIRQKLFQTTCYIDTAVTISNRNNFTCAEKCALYHGTYILNTYGKIDLGNNSHLGSMCYVNVYYGNLSIGNDVAIGPGTKIIVYSNHYRFGRKVTKERLTNDIFIGNNVFIGANCVILSGANICDNIVIGAGSVVKGTLKSNSIYAGSPCKLIKTGWYE